MSKVTITLTDDGLPFDDPAASYSVQTEWEPAQEPGGILTTAQMIGLHLQEALLQNPNATKV